MQEALDDLCGTIARFRNRISIMSEGALNDPVGDAEDRAAVSLLISGAIEQFIRNVVKAHVNVICNSSVAFNDLPESIRKHHFEGGARFLVTVEKRDRRSSSGNAPNPYIESRNVSARLASVNEESYELVWEAYADTESNPGPDTIKKILKRLGVSSVWQEIEANVPADLSDLSVGGALSNKLISDLRELINSRNRCAHGYAHSAAPGYSALTGYLRSVEAIASGIVHVLQEQQKDYV